MQTFAFQSAPPVASLIWEKQGSAIIGDADYDNLGSSSVALSADAKTLLVGAPQSYNNTERGGYVKVYHMTNDGRNRIQLEMRLEISLGILQIFLLEGIL
jgi:hypothetical protein